MPSPARLVGCPGVFVEPFFSILFFRLLFSQVRHFLGGGGGVPKSRVFFFTNFYSNDDSYFPSTELYVPVCFSLDIWIYYMFLIFLVFWYFPPPLFWFVFL